MSGFRLGVQGDLHGIIKCFNDSKESCRLTDLYVQIGDFPIGWGQDSLLHEMDPTVYKVLGGNHDNYDVLSQWPHNLGDFGVFDLGDTGKKAFFVRGAWTPLFLYNAIPGINWWPNEELSREKMEACLDLWKQECENVEIVLSHDCPLNITHAILNPYGDSSDTIYSSNTSELLYEMWKYHEPPTWVFGHYHKKFEKMVGRTNFICLYIGEERFFDF